MKILITIFIAAALLITYPITAKAVWEQASSTPSDDLFWGVGIGDADNIYVAGISDSGGCNGGCVYASHNAGQSWRAQSPSSSFFLLGCDFVSKDEGWVGGMSMSFGPCLFHTTNGATTWVQQNVPGSFGDMVKALRKPTH